MRTQAVLTLILGIAAGGAAAQDRVAALDVAVDFREYAGKRVVITGCTMTAADLNTVFCAITSKTGQVGNLIFQSAEMDRETLRYLLNECAGFDVRPACRMDLEAQIEVDGNEPRLTGARRVGE